MFLIRNVKLPYDHDETALRQAAAKALRISPGEITALQILRRSYDCRRKPVIYAVYSLLAECTKEDRVRRHLRSLPDVSDYAPVRFRFSVTGTETLTGRPAVIGSGPAGLFCALELARAGYRPLIFERGKPVEERLADVERFWKTGDLDPESNLQFGEGGAGTFSDGKLTTGVKDKDGRCRKVLEEFVRFGADPDILVSAAPHVGSDVLVRMLVRMRSEIEALGGTFCFRRKLTGLVRNRTDGTMTLCFSDGSLLRTQAAVLAIGNGAQDTFRMLYESGIRLEQKPFAVGLRIEHPQQRIDENAYGMEHRDPRLPAASYKLTARCGTRGVYSFCMCPGGHVVHASSVPGRTVVNGMSYHDRGGRNANAAIVMTVDGRDFGSDHPLAGLEYQCALEEKAYALCDGRIPQQRLSDFKSGSVSSGYGSILSDAKGRTGFSDLGVLFSPEQKAAFSEAMDRFDRKIPGFADPDAVLSGVESRTSSPVRIPRGEHGTGDHAALYPCGEGAGYAGGIVSAAMDGLKSAQQIAARFRPILKE